MDTKVLRGNLWRSQSNKIHHSARTYLGNCFFHFRTINDRLRRVIFEVIIFRLCSCITTFGGHLGFEWDTAGPGSGKQLGRPGCPARRALGEIDKGIIFVWKSNIQESAVSRIWLITADDVRGGRLLRLFDAINCKRVRVELLRLSLFWICMAIQYRIICQIALATTSHVRRTPPSFFFDLQSQWHSVLFIHHKQRRSWQMSYSFCTLDDATHARLRCDVGLVAIMHSASRELKNELGFCDA